jgi:aerobic carbon-monoxide dehydrogenase large subunit
LVYVISRKHLNSKWLFLSDQSLDIKNKFQLGQSAPRLEDYRFLTGAAEYAADLNRDGQLHAVMIRSVHAHARILDIDTSEALDMDRVIGVHTVADLDADGLGLMPCPGAADHLSFSIVPPRPALARDRVRHVGDPVAIVIAETHAEALAAAEVVIIEYDPLPALADIPTREQTDTPITRSLIWEEAPGNVAFRFEKGNRAEVMGAFDQAAHVVELDVVNNRVTAAPMEPRAGIGEYDARSETYTLTCNAQGVHTIRGQLAKAVFNVPNERFRVCAPDVGGGFGLKNFLYPEWILLPWAAKRYGRPVKWVAERGEDFSAAVHGRDSRVAGRLALDVEGRFLALSASVVANMGAYLSGGAPGIASKAFPTALGGIYDIPLIHMEACGVFTNTAPVDAYRGAGKPEANFITERLIEAAARRCGFDPVELRRINAIASFPHVTALGMNIDTGRFKANIEDAARLSDRAGFEARRQKSVAGGRLRGLGLSCFLETARGNPEEGAEVRFTAQRVVELCLGTESNGQGHHTAFTQIAADKLGLPVDCFNFIQADTDKTRLGYGHGGARSMHMGGGALAKALDAVLEKARAIAAQMLQTPATELKFADGRFTASDSDQSIGLMDVAQDAKGGLDSFEMVSDAPFTFPSGCHTAEVEIDPETGSIELLRYIAVDDYGRLINPALCEGQVIGGLAQGIGQAIGEHVIYDPESAQLISGSLMDYLVPRASQLPRFELHLEGTPTAANPLGVKGSGQAGCIGAPQTIVNAVLDALSPLGIDHLDMPLTNESVWRAIRGASVP